MRLFAKYILNITARYCGHMFGFAREQMMPRFSMVKFLYSYWRETLLGQVYSLYSMLLHCINIAYSLSMFVCDFYMSMDDMRPFLSQTWSPISSLSRILRSSCKSLAMFGRIGKVRALHLILDIR